MVTPVPDQFNFPAEEEKILELWKKLDAFQTSLKQSKDRPRYTFYDGPPFATGLPHYGHILAGTIKVCLSAIIYWPQIQALLRVGGKEPSIHCLCMC